MKKLDPNKLLVDESRSNPMVVALQHPECPINEICAYMVVGFGTVPKQCQHAKTTDDSLYCTYGDIPQQPDAG